MEQVQQVQLTRLIREPKPFFTKGVVVRVIIACAVIAFTIIVVSAVVENKRAPSTEQAFVISEKDNLYAVAKNLKAQNIISYRTPFLLSYYAYTSDAPITPGVYRLSGNMTSLQVLHELELEPWAKRVTIPPDLTKEQLGEFLGSVLGWEQIDREFFPNTLSGMQWQKYQDGIQELFRAKFEWNKTKTETFLALTALYHDPEYDFFRYMYIPDTYEIPLHLSRAQVAGMLIDRFEKEYPGTDATAVSQFLDQTAMNNVANLIEKEIVLMPDIAVLPPRDVTLKKEGEHTYLLFTTTYWNKGRGPLELIADPATRDDEGDVERKVFQRIYRLDGDYEERVSGTFLWHQPHSHYHFIDFAEYLLEAVDAPMLRAEPMKSKTTFCVRDMEPVDLAHPGARKSPMYSVCSKERQGISQGWADSYYYTYRDQRFDVTNLPQGTYRLSIRVNPDNRFDEITRENNIGEVTLQLNVEEGTMTILEESKSGKSLEL